MKKILKPFLLGLLGWAVTSTVVYYALLGLLASMPGLTGAFALILAAIFVLSIIRTRTRRALWVGMLVGVITGFLVYVGGWMLYFS